MGSVRRVHEEPRVHVKHVRQGAAFLPMTLPACLYLRPPPGVSHSTRFHDAVLTAATPVTKACGLCVEEAAAGVTDPAVERGARLLDSVFLYTASSLPWPAEVRAARASDAACNLSASTIGPTHASGAEDLCPLQREPAARAGSVQTSRAGHRADGLLLPALSVLLFLTSIPCPRTHLTRSYSPHRLSRSPPLHCHPRSWSGPRTICLCSCSSSSRSDRPSLASHMVP